MYKPNAELNNSFKINNSLQEFPNSCLEFDISTSVSPVKAIGAQPFLLLPKRSTVDLCRFLFHVNVGVPNPYFASKRPRRIARMRKMCIPCTMPSCRKCDISADGFRWFRLSILPALHFKLSNSLFTPV